MLLPKFDAQVNGVDVTGTIKKMALDIVRVYKKLNASINPDELPLLMAAGSLAYQWCHFSKVFSPHFGLNSQHINNSFNFFPFCLISGRRRQEERSDAIPGRLFRNS